MAIWRYSKQDTHCCCRFKWGLCLTSLITGSQPKLKLQVMVGQNGSCDTKYLWYNSIITHLWWQHLGTPFKSLGQLVSPRWCWGNWPPQWHNSDCLWPLSQHVGSPPHWTTVSSTIVLLPCDRLKRGNSSSSVTLSFISGDWMVNVHLPWLISLRYLQGLWFFFFF